MATQPVLWGVSPAVTLNAVLSVLIVTSGCRVGPDYVTPQASIAPTWIDAHDARLQGEPLNPTYWWRVFNDPDLEYLVALAVNENLTLRQAGMRVLEARAIAAGTRGLAYPQLQQITADFEHTQVSANRANASRIPNFQRDFDNWQLDFRTAWELDFWGRFQRAVAAADAELDASIDQRNDVLVILLADVAATYIELRTVERRIQLARRNVELQMQTLSLVGHRVEAGSVGEIDLAQAEANLGQTKALVAQLELLQREANNRLCVLTGQPTRLLETSSSGRGLVPSPPETLALQVPADLLRRRPDVRQAERLLAAQSERIGIAQTDLYPHLSITGRIGLESGNFSNLFQSDSWGGGIGPSLRWDILNYGRILSGVQAQRARFQQLLYAYQHSVLKADAEVESAITRFIKAHERKKFLSQSSDAIRRAVELSEIRYAGGKADFNELFTLQGQLVSNLDEVAATEGEIALAFVTIYRGLGGGWECAPGDAGGSMPPTEFIMQPPSNGVAIAAQP